MKLKNQLVLWLTGLKRGNFSDYRSKNTSGKRQSLYCDHYKMQGHSIDKCWKIHGYPPKFKNNIWKKVEETSNKANMVSAETGAESNKHHEPRLTQEQYTQLLNILNRQ